MGEVASVLIVGGGGHGKVVAEVARSAGYSVAGYADLDAAKMQRIVEPGGSRVVTTQALLLASLAETGRLPGGATCVALAIGNNRGRLNLFSSLRRASMPVLVHASASVSQFAHLGLGTVVAPRAVINPDCVTGSAVIINTAAVVEHDCELGDGVHISPGALLAGGVSVGARSWVGIGAVVIQGIRIGADVVIGAGAVVIRDVADGLTVVGNPARPLDPRERAGP